MLTRKIIITRPRRRTKQKNAKRVSARASRKSDGATLHRQHRNGKNEFGTPENTLRGVPFFW
jgi:hypothetical protein